MKSIVHFRSMRTFSIVGLFWGGDERESRWGRTQEDDQTHLFSLHLLSVVNNGETNDRK